MLALTYLGKGLPERAVIEAAKARELDSERPDIISMQGMVLARAGYVREALKAIDDLKRLAGERNPLALGDRVRLHRPRRPRSRLRVARQSRRRALLGKLPVIGHMPPSWSLSQKFRSDPRFGAWLKHIGPPA
jgi:hypothetical protein